LKLHLASAENHITDSGARAAIEHARAELNQTLQELRDLARGIHPAVLAQAGLAAALEGVAERFPLPIQVDAPRSRYNPDAEATAYFMVCEALANIVKHAGATRAHVHVEQADGELKVKVTDDGCGGAAFPAGGGLEGMRDRVAALAGAMTVTSPSGGGTKVEASIPCE
jgi:signal transduction histidine kinase